jgi:hypothetical protein
MKGPKKAQEGMLRAVSGLHAGDEKGWRPLKEVEIRNLIWLDLEELRLAHDRPQRKPHLVRDNKLSEPRP